MNAVSPGSIDTPGLSERLTSSEAGQEHGQMIAKNVPLGWQPLIAVQMAQHDIRAAIETAATLPIRRVTRKDRPSTTY